MKREPIVRVTTGLKSDRIVRRYVDLTKYLELLRTRSLYLRRADKFTDRFEGALTPGIRKLMDAGPAQGHVIGGAHEFWRKSRMGSYVSCWNLGAKDNMALWQLYGGASAATGLSSSVAITTTVGRLIAAGLEWREPKDVEIHKVEYIDHFKNPDMVVGNYTDMLKYKHEAFKYEGEIRIIVPRLRDDLEMNPDGILLPLGDLKDFIRSVVVAPEAPAWFFELIEDVTAKYGVTSPVRRSKLTHLPR